MVTRASRVRFAGRAFLLGALFVPVAGAADGADAPPVAPPAEPAPPTPAAKRDLPRQTIDLGGGVAFEMVLLPAGEFDMGSPVTEPGRRREEELHRVRITKPFWLGTTEVTRAAWALVMETRHSSVNAALPIAGVSWDDTQAFLERLNATVEGAGFRLPTEAEWEYGCRAGGSTTFCCGDGEERLPEHAWYDANSGGRLHPVGGLKPNAWGLHDMHGGVWEWCADGFTFVLAFDRGGVTSDPVETGESFYRVARGGSRHDSSTLLRSAHRGGFVPSERNRVDVGFRLARTISADAPPPKASGHARAGTTGVRNCSRNDDPAARELRESHLTPIVRS